MCQVEYRCITVTITAKSAATANYNAASKTVTIKVVPASTASLLAANQSTGSACVYYFEPNRRLVGDLVQMSQEDITSLYTTGRMTAKSTDAILGVVKKRTTGPERKGNAADTYRQNEKYKPSV